MFFVIPLFSLTPSVKGQVQTPSVFAISLQVIVNGQSEPTIIFGMNPNARFSTDFCSNFNPPSPYYSAFFSDSYSIASQYADYNTTTDYLTYYHGGLTYLSKYIVPTSGYNVWNLEVSGGSGNITVTWNETSGAPLTLFDLLNRKLADMNQVSNYTFNQVENGEADFRIVLQSAAYLTTSPTPTSTTQTSVSPTVPELTCLMVVPLLLSIFFVAVLLRHRKNLK